MSSNLYAIVMAGGSGTRFWPLSRQSNPKQVLKITGSKSLIQYTLDRMEDLIPVDKTFVVTNAQQVSVIKSQLPQLIDDNYLLEPVPRNTAPCIGLAAFHVQRIDPDAIMLVVPADHRIKDVKRFQECVRTGAKVLEKHEGLITIGIPPTRPETGYGYIQFEEPVRDLPDDVYRVKAFAEKPNLSTAQRFVESGDFNWNSGSFMWKVSTILHEMEEHLPEQFNQLALIDQAYGTSEAEETLETRFKLIRPISIDYGVMEVTTKPIFMLNGNFGWSDVGSWDEVYRISEKDKDANVFTGNAVSIDTKSCYIYSPNRMTALVGVEDLLVINTQNATLICPRDRAQDVKQIVDMLEKEGEKDYL